MTTTVSYACYRYDNTQIVQGPDVGEIISRISFNPLATRSHDPTYKYIKEYSQDAPCKTRQMTVSIRIPNDKMVAEPANQGAFANKYFIFIEAKHIDNAYVLLPDIANRNRAGDNPSHFVSTFFTVKGVHEQRVPTQTRTTHGFVVCGRPLKRHRGEWNKTQN